MITPNRLNHNNTKEFSIPKFHRRADLTNEKRFMIGSLALEAQQSKIYGSMTDIAKQFNVCRQIVYDFKNRVQEMITKTFSPSSKKSKKINKKKELAHMASLRFENRSPIDGISMNMKRLNFPYTSSGYISQNLSFIGNLMPNTIEIETDAMIFLIIAIDELYSKNQPILISVDPISSAILKIELASNRSAKTWSKHLQELNNSGIKVIKVVNDEGKGLCAAIEKELPDVVKQFDTFHAISHRLGAFVPKLEKRVNKEKDKVEKCEEDFYRVKREIVLEKKFELWEKAVEDYKEKLEIYNNFKYLYHCAINQLKPFHHNGEIREKQKAKQEIETALDLIESLGEIEINKKITGIRKILPDLLNYFDQTKKSVDILREMKLDEEIIKTLSLGWQWNKAVVKAKLTERKKEACKQREDYLERAKMILKSDYAKIKADVFSELDNIVQASSMVENINSILRPYLDNSKNQINQEFLNFFMFYHNHRRYRAGKRKGKTPNELLTGIEQTEDWTELMCERIKKKVPDFFH